MSKHKDADLILKLYDLRREAVMREARNWFFTFNPTGVQDFVDVMLSDKSGYYRMVVSYWDMAASLVNCGAIDEDMFNEANGEHLFIYSRIQPFLSELRTYFNAPDSLKNLEQLVMRRPNAEQELAGIRERMKKFAALREQRAAKAQTAGVES
ncbi:MAG TPA: hypothetical protein VJ124_15845 [Pyrinomonadaceae bacterium]|nr:hypothetical protein [Pyrinomonadaceae bacterium]